MRKLYKIVLVTFLILVLIIGALAAAAFGFYHMYLKPVSADYELAQSVSDISAIEVVSIKQVGDGKLEISPIKPVSDVDAFMADFNALECTKGVSIEALIKLSSIDGIEAIKITYAGGDFEVITPYGNIDSTVFTPDVTLETILNEEFFFFDADEFSGLIDKYN